MFKGEYQGGPFVDVFSAQGRDPLSKKCKVTGSSTNIHKQYDKDVKSYVYVLEGEPTTTKIQFPKEDKHGLFLTQKFLVFQLFLPVGRPFSFEVAVSDQAQNKRRIFFSSNLRDISVTPLHAKFPLTILNLGSWLNMCLDLESLVSDTFNGPKFRAVESFTVTANCRIKKVFTLRTPPVDTSDDQNLVVTYPNSEPLPRNLQLITTSDVSITTQILSYTNLYRKADENASTPVSTPSGHDGTTPRQDQETHIAFGTKVIIPPHLRRNSLKENRESNKILHNSRLSSSKIKHGQSAPDVRHINDDIVKSPLSPKGNEESGWSDSNPQGVDANQATIQPRPPRTSSAGKIRRPIRLKSSGKTRTAGKIDNENANEKRPDSLKINSVSSEQKSPGEMSGELPDPSKDGAMKTSLIMNVESSVSRPQTPPEEMSGELPDPSKARAMKISLIMNVESSVSRPQTPPEEINQERSKILDASKTVKTSLKSVDIVNHGADERLETVDVNASSKSSMSEKLEMKQRVENGIEDEPISFNRTNTDALSQETSIKSFHNGDARLSFKGLSGFTNDDSSKIQAEISAERADQKQISNDYRTKTGNITRLSNSNIDFINANASVNKSTNKQSLDNIISEEDIKNIDMNNNDPLTDKGVDQPRIRPRKLPLASNNPVFTFASMPRSPRSGKRKLLESPMVDDVITPSLEVPPEVMVSLTEDTILKDTPVKNTGQSERNRGASLEDDFCKLSDDDNHDEDADGIQKLLQSSLSPRHSPMPFHHQLRQSIRSSMLKEIPSPVKENGYDAQNYQSDDHLDTLNQSRASSWRFDTSDSSSSFNQTQQDLEDSLNNTSFPKAVRHIAADIPVVDDNEEDGHSDCSDDTTCSTWRTPPQDLRGNKYQNEMKPLGQEPDLTATICMDPRDYCDVFSPPIILGTPNKENNSAISNLSPLKSPHKLPANHQEEEELDLLYDPCLNCYFDPMTHKYYELA